MGFGCWRLRKAGLVVSSSAKGGKKRRRDVAGLMAVNAYGVVHVVVNL